MPDTPRRWSFSLQLVFALVTVVCLVLASVFWPLNWIRARHNAIEKGYVSVVEGPICFAGDPPKPPAWAPSGLWLFGVQAVDLLIVDKENLKSAKRLFPEAEIAALTPVVPKPPAPIVNLGTGYYLYIQSSPGRQFDTNRARQRIRKALEEPTNLEFVATPLTEVVDYFRDLHGIDIQIDNKGLEAAGAATDTPVTKTLHGIRLAAALDMLLAPLDLVYVNKGYLLSITTHEKARLDVSVQAYDCRWAADRIPQLVEMLRLAKSAGLPKSKNASAAVDPVEIVPAGQTIVVRASALQHDAIERLLSRLRRTGLQAEVASEAAEAR